MLQTIRRDPKNPNMLRLIAGRGKRPETVQDMPLLTTTDDGKVLAWSKAGEVAPVPGTPVTAETAATAEVPVEAAGMVDGTDVEAALTVGAVFDGTTPEPVVEPAPEVWPENIEALPLTQRLYWRQRLNEREGREALVEFQADLRALAERAAALAQLDKAFTAGIRDQFNKVVSFKNGFDHAIEMAPKK